ncbi:MAG: hypothetical protein AAB150_05975 [Pseudomonadota bacterium]
MDHRCPVCRKAIVRRGLSQTIMIKLEIQCPHCKNMVAYNIHRIENTIVLLDFAAIVVLAAFAYWLQSRGLVVIAVAAALVGAAAMPLIERTWLRNWPRYAAIVQHPGA